MTKEECLLFFSDAINNWIEEIKYDGSADLADRSILRFYWQRIQVSEVLSDKNFEAAMETQERMWSQLETPVE